MSALASTLATIWRLASPYFRSPEGFWGRILLASVIAIELGVVAITVLINRWNNDFYNALQERDWDTFISQMIYFSVLAAIFILLRVYQLYLNQWLQIRWRRWMTEQYLGRWLAHGTHYRMQLHGDAADNPDQRIAEDIRDFIDSGSGVGILPIGIGLLSSVVTLVSFSFILWGLSDAAGLVLFGWTIPGYLFWAALIYAVVGTLLTHLIGRALIPLNYAQQRYEADFRFNLVRVRENSEQIALLHGEGAERGRLGDRFAVLAANWMKIMQRTKLLSFFTNGYGQVSIIFPYIVVSPAYFAGRIQLGALMQTASAFGSVQDALSFFISVYRAIAEWTAVIQRLDGFNASMAAADAMRQESPRVVAVTDQGQSAIAVKDVALHLPNGESLMSTDGVTLPRGDEVLLTGPSGSGKSTFFRAIAGIWPFGKGSISLPRDAKVMMLPQRPYFPVATLSQAVTYPAEPGAYPAEAIAEVLTAVGLPELVSRLDEEAHWNRTLSIGEQQRLAIARAILEKPDFLFLDEATASLDEPAEAALYKLLRERLKGAAIISIGHRSTLRAFHRKGLAMVPHGAAHRLEAQ